MAQKIFGIDLGTTNSCLAVMEAGGPRVIAIDGEPIVPSVVSLDRQAGRFLVGRRARNRQVAEPAWTVRSIKRRMGETAPVQLGDRELLPEEVSAEILRHLKERGEEALGAPVERVVLTVPAYFGDAQRRATIRAGELAGLEVVRLLNEPTAAALVYDRLVARQIEPLAAPTGLDGPDASDDEPDLAAAAAGPDGSQRILVYDLGGGTFDVSVVEIGGGINEVRASGGNNRLGGDDFDHLLAEHLAVLLREKSGKELPRDLRLAARLEDAAERAKIDLSSRPFARVIEEALLGSFHLDLEVRRESFEELIETLLQSTLTEVDRALAEARLSAEQIDRVVLVGGSTHIPRVQELLAERFVCPVEHAVDPALCVALGAAVQGAILAGEVFDHILVDVAAHSLGIKTLDNVFTGWGGRTADHFSPVIRRNTQVPVTRSEVYSTVVEDQERVTVEVYQGESPRCSENTLIGQFLFPLLPAPRKSPILVEFRYDLDGIIRVAVHQKGTDNRKEVTLSTRAREEASAGPAGPVENYILRKARALAASSPESALRERLGAAAGAYEEILADPGADPGAVDLAEEELLEVLNEAEEAPVGR
jgi:molecular chaperone DnaK